MLHLSEKIINLPSSARQLTYWSEAAENIPEDEVQLILKHTGLTQAQQNALDQIRGFLFQAINASKNGESRILVLRGEWGLGKTLLSKAIKSQLIQKISENTGINIVYKELNLGNILSDVIRECREAYDAERCFSGVFLRPAEALILQPNTIVILFVDEFEWLIWHRSGVVGDRKIIELMEAFMKIFRDRSSYVGKKYGGKVHIIFASTPSAYQIFISSLKEKEFHGWLERRVDTVDLYPAMKHEVIKIIDVLIEELLKINPDTLFKDCRFKELIYTVSQGNLGTVIATFNRIIYYSIMKCVESTGKNCIYQIDENLLITSLLNTAISTPIGKENPLDRVMFNQLLANTYGREEKINSLLKTLFISSSVLFQKDYDNLSDKLLEYSLKEYGVRLLKCKSFIIGNQNELLKTIENLTNIIVGDYANSQYEKYTIKLSLSNTIHLLDSRNYVISIPEDAESFAGLLSFYEPISISADTFRQMINTFQKISEGILESIILAPEEYMRLYPVITPSTIPFIHRRSNAKVAYIKAREEMNNNIARFEHDLEAAIEDLMITLGLAERDRSTRRLNIVISEGLEVIKAPLNVKVFVENVVKNAEKFKEICGETKLCILICPENVDLDILTEIFEDWNRIIIPMKLRDIYYLVASVIARREKFDISKDELEKYYRTLARKYKLDSIGRLWKREGLKRGVIVPRELLNMYSLPIREKNPLAAFRDGYRTLLLGGDSFTLEDLIARIARIYRAIPYHGRDGKFCGIDVPSYIKVDLEPEGTTGVVSEDKIAERAKTYLQSILAVATSNNMVEYHEGTKIRIRLSLHPIEKRVLDIISNECKNPHLDGISISSLKDKFIFATDERASSRVFSTLIKILEARGHIIVESGKIKCTDIRKYVSKSYNYIGAEWNRYREIENNILHLLEEGNLSPPTLENTILHVVVAKEKGWKLILLKDVDLLVQEFIDNIDYTQGSLGLRNLRFANETIHYAIGLASRMIMKAAKYIVNIRSNIESIESKFRQIRTEVENTAKSYPYIKPIYNALKKHIDNIEDRINEVIKVYENTVSNISLDDILKIGRTLLNKKSDREKLKPYFHYEHGCTGTYEITTYYNLVLYKLYEKVEKKLRENVQKSIENLEKIKKEIDSLTFLVEKTSKSLSINAENLKKYIENLVSHEAEILKRCTNISSCYEDVLRCRERIAQELDSLRKREREIKEREELLRNAEESLKDIQTRYNQLVSTVSEVAEKLEKSLGQFTANIPGLENRLSLFSKLLGELRSGNIKETLEKLEREIVKRDLTLSDLKAIVNYRIPDLYNKYTNNLERASNILRDTSEVINKTISDLYNTMNNLMNKLGEKLPESVMTSELIPRKLLLTEKKSRIQNLLDTMANALNNREAYSFNELSQELMEFLDLTRKMREVLFRNLGLEKDAELVFVTLKTLTGESTLRSTVISELITQLAKRTGLSEKRVLDMLYILAKTGLITVRMEIHL